MGGGAQAAEAGVERAVGAAEVTAPTIYFALGSADRFVLEALRGMDVLESFAYQRDHYDRYRPTWRSAFLDSGAFTEMTQGVAIDLDAYVEFCQAHGGFYRHIANLDDIKGDLARTQANLRRLHDAGVPALPVFHQGEPWSALEDAISAAPQKWIGIGFQRPIAGAERWLDEVFGRLGGRAKVHGFAMTSYLHWPFGSVDSSTWVYEWRALMAVQGQGADALRCLTPGELLEIVLKKYIRAPRARSWGVEGGKQLTLIGGGER